MKLLYKILDIVRFVFIAIIIAILIYKFLKPQEIHLELNNYLQTTIFIFIAIEALRIFGPKNGE